MSKKYFSYAAAAAASKSDNSLLELISKLCNIVCNNNAQDRPNTATTRIFLKKYHKYLGKALPHLEMRVLGANKSLMNVEITCQHNFHPTYQHVQRKTMN